LIREGLETESTAGHCVLEHNQPNKTPGRAEEQFTLARARMLAKIGPTAQSAGLPLKVKF